MVEPLTLTTVSTVILTEGIKFLYGQATEALKAWRGRQQRRQDTTAPTPLPVSTNALEGSSDAWRFYDMERMPATRIQAQRSAPGCQSFGKASNRSTSVTASVWRASMSCDAFSKGPSTSATRQRRDAAAVGHSDRLEGVVEVNGVTGLVAGVHADRVPSDWSSLPRWGTGRSRRCPGSGVWCPGLVAVIATGAPPPASSKSSGTESDEK